METKKLSYKEKIIIKAASIFLSEYDEMGILASYEKLSEVNGDDLASDHVLVWERFELLTVDQLSNLILDEIEALEKLFPSHPQFIEKIDWASLKEQKEMLVVLSNHNLGEIVSDHLDGIISLIDSIQDYAVDEMGLNENKVFNLK